MGDTGAVRVRGADEVERTLRKLSKDIEQLPDEVAPRGADLIAQSARSYARVLTGRMRGSIEVNQTPEGAQVVAGEGLGAYPGVQEYGSKRHGISPNRYMARAAEAGEPRVVELFENEVANAADKVKGA